uniref:Uncharacterized protein n=1 Tax=Anguilla anguilla TaxID=7936 RepID=A0A0E9RVH0_ANGAN
MFKSFPYPEEDIKVTIRTYYFNSSLASLQVWVPRSDLLTLLTTLEQIQYSS